MGPSMNALRLAGRRLALCFGEAAAGFEADFGFTWRASPLAAHTLANLEEEVRICRRSAMPLRVSSEHCENTIYPGPACNMQFRFVHDMVHVELSADFDVEGELAVARAHQRRILSYGFDEHSLEYQMITADTAGQTLLHDATGHFPVSQIEFVTACINGGIAAAIETEKRRLRLHAAA